MPVHTRVYKALRYVMTCYLFCTVVHSMHRPYWHVADQPFDGITCKQEGQSPAVLHSRSSSHVCCYFALSEDIKFPILCNSL